MAVDICPSSDVPISPRISFSHDLNSDPSSEIDSIDPLRSDQFLLSPTFDFDFRTSSITPADELFSNGQILPTQIKIPQIATKTTQFDPKLKSKSPDSDTQKKQLKQLKELIEDQENSQSQSQSQSQFPSSLRSFWQFTRSASLNCDNQKLGPRGLLRSLSIKSLARSNSTGSALNPKRDPGRKVVEKSKDPILLRRCSSLNQPMPVYYTYRNSSSRGGIRVIPVLNIPPVYSFSKGSLSFFGCGSVFCNGKVKKKSKV